MFFFLPFFKKMVFGIIGPHYCGIGATIRIGQEMLCLPYAGFLILRPLLSITFPQGFQIKLDGVGPLDSRPSANKPSADKLHQIVKKKSDIWHMTCDTWHVTHDTWHVTRDTLGGMNILSKFQLPSSYRLWFMILWKYWGKGSLTYQMNELISDKAVYRTAPATPGLLIIGHPTSGRGGKKTFKWCLEKWKDTQTDTQTFRFLESMGPEGRCFENDGSW